MSALLPITTYFGDSRDALYPSWYLTLHDQSSIIELESFSKMKRLLNVQSLHFLRQVHGTQGTVIADAQAYPSFAREGDFLLTNVPGVGIGVMTGDCLPIILYDCEHHAAGVVHAGWRGALAGVVPTALERMQAEYGTQPSTVHVQFGPSARSCCYVVGDDFVHHLAAYTYGAQALHRRDGRLFFDLSHFCQLQLHSLGVSPQAIAVENNHCTMCTERYFSHRRQKEQAGRQMTVVSLHSL